jgi:hypothetical protein
MAADCRGMIDVAPREVWTSAQEFTRGVRLAFPGQVSEGPGMLAIEDGAGAAMSIVYAVENPVRVASISLPVLRVAIRFSAGTSAQQLQMLRTLDRAMHRGGG